MSYKNTLKEKKLQELRTKNPLAMENEWLRNKVRELEEIIDKQSLFTKSTDLKTETFLHYTPEVRWKLIRAGVKYKDFAIVKVIGNKVVDIFPDVDING